MNKFNQKLLTTGGTMKRRVDTLGIMNAWMKCHANSY